MGQQEMVANRTAVRRIVMVLLVAAVIEAMVAATAGPAFAANDKANPIGREVSADNQSNPGAGGETASKLAKANGGLGDIARHEPRRV